MTRRNHLSVLTHAFAYLSLVFVLTGPLALAQNPEPEALIRSISTEVLATIKGDKDIQAGNISKINTLVESKILPHVDFTRMTASAVGRYWSGATPEQQRKILTEFRQLLIYTYAGALTEVKDQTIRFRPSRPSQSDREAEVRSQIIQARGGEPIQLDYRLEKGPDGWKILDVNILGVWLVETYRSSFASEVTKGGVDGLIKTLTDKNASLAKSVAARSKT